MTYECTEARFLKDVAEHQMIVIRDDGVHRHIRFKKPGTYCMHFDLITWPGYLCYTGDMGTYVFSRIEDMFEFFRIDPRDWSYNRAGGLSINPGYWSEKLQAVSCTGRSNGGATEFDADAVRDNVKRQRREWIREAKELGLDKELRRELFEAVEDEVLNRLDDGEHEAVTAIQGFSWTDDPSSRLRLARFSFDDFWGSRHERFTFHFLWCCYALAWGVQKYDESKRVEVAA